MRQAQSSVPCWRLPDLLLAELSLIKLAITWLILVAFPALILGLAFPLLSAWLTKVSDKAVAFTGLGSAILLTFLGAVAWFGLRPMLRAAESNFWALHSIVVQPFYALVREGIRHIAEASILADPAKRFGRKSAPTPRWSRQPFA